MKKVILAGAILAAMSTMGAAHAAGSGQINFTGAISAASCDMNVVVGGNVQPGGVVDLGVWKTTDASAVGVFGNPVTVVLQPDAATCDVDPTTLNVANVKIDTATVNAGNTSVVTTPETGNTSAGVLFTLANGDAVVNKGAQVLALGGANVDAATGAIKFKAQPYALSGTLRAGIIGGSVNYTVGYN